MKPRKTTVAGHATEWTSAYSACFAVLWSVFEGTKHSASGRAHTLEAAEALAEGAVRQLRWLVPSCEDSAEAPLQDSIRTCAA